MSLVDIRGHGLDALTWRVYNSDELKEVRFEEKVFRLTGELYLVTAPQIKHLIDTIEKEFTKLAAKEAYGLLMPEVYKGDND